MWIQGIWYSKQDTRYKKKKIYIYQCTFPNFTSQESKYRIFCKRTKKEQKLRDKSKERHLTYNLNSKAFLRKTQVRLGAQYCELWDWSTYSPDDFSCGFFNLLINSFYTRYLMEQREIKAWIRLVLHLLSLLRRFPRTTVGVEVDVGVMFITFWATRLQ